MSFVVQILIAHQIYCHLDIVDASFEIVLDNLFSPTCQLIQVQLADGAYRLRKERALPVGIQDQGQTAEAEDQQPGG